MSKGISPFWRINHQNGFGDNGAMEKANMIKHYRDLGGLSLDKLADMVGTTAQQLSRLERGERRLTDTWMRRIAPHLGVEPKDLVSDGSAAATADVHPMGYPIGRVVSDMTRSRQPPIVAKLRRTINEMLDEGPEHGYGTAAKAARELALVLESILEARESKSDPTSASGP
jgi:transcriptional regulator with XRE-family HTH domain